jgi:uncharacterized membrane protein YcjF (UPF0283 family)
MTGLEGLFVLCLLGYCVHTLIEEWNHNSWLTWLGLAMTIAIFIAFIS